VKVPAFAFLMAALAGPAASAGAPGSGEAWLEAMTAALRAQAYEGLLSYAREDGVTELRLIHGHHGSAIYERLSRLDGEGKELLRRGDEVYFLGAQDESLSEAALPLVRHPVANFDAIPESYEVRLGARVTVGGRKAQQVRVDPRDSYRFAYHLWLDAETALPLRLTMNHPQGAPVEVMQFRALAVGEEPPEAAFQVPDGAPHQHPLAPAFSPDAEAVTPPTLQRVPWRLAWVPPGFKLLAEIAEAPAMLRLGDGLATVTVFIDAAVEDAPVAVQDGPTAAVVRHRPHCDGAAYQITVIGEVPLPAAERIAESLHCTDAAS
jgi:sigma-E factor negative regulatory protein RseB